MPARLQALREEIAIEIACDVGELASTRQTGCETLLLELGRRMIDLEDVRGVERGDPMHTAVEPGPEDDDLPAPRAECHGELRIDRERAQDERIDVPDDAIACPRG